VSAAPGAEETRGRFVSISWKLAGTTVAVVTVVAACVYFALSRYERDRMLESKEAAAAMVVRLYADTAVAPLTFGDDRGVQEVVALLGGNLDIIHASAWAATDKARTVGARLGELRRGDPVDAPTTIPNELEVHRTASAVIVDAPVKDPTGKLVGVVQAAFSLAHEQEALAATERRTLGISVATSILLTAVLLLLARRLIVRPIGRLVGAANALERGDQTRAPYVNATANDEIGSLATAFVSMAAAIEQRERRIAERNRDLRRVLDNAEDGFLAVTPAGEMSEERSQIIERWFGRPAPGAKLFDYMEQMAGERAADWLRIGWEFVIDGIMPVEVALDQLPSRFQKGDRYYSVAYRGILDATDGETLRAVLVVIRDVTEKISLERAEQMQRQMMVIFTHMMTDRAAFDAFFKDATLLLESIERTKTLDDETLRRQIHTLKGNAAIFGLEGVAAACHELESRMADENERPTPAQIGALRSLWDGIASTYGRFSGDLRESSLTLHDDDHRELLGALESGRPPEEILSLVGSWRFERASSRMTAIADQITALARRLGKGGVTVEVAPTRLRLPQQRWAPFWSAFAHVVRNAVDHGLEPPDVRRAQGKPEEGVVRMSVALEGDSVLFRFGDDGAGIDWDRLAVKAKEQGLSAETAKDLEAALFADRVSTRDVATATSGRGVGMSAVHTCVTALGGTIAVESARGKGTTWLFRFPKDMLDGDAPLPSAAVRGEPTVASC